MSQPFSVGLSRPPPSREDFEALARRQNEVAVRCMALENVVRGLGAWLAAALPEAAGARFLDSLSTPPETTLDPAMPPEAADRLKEMVAREQRHIVDLIRGQNHRRAEARPDAERPPET